MVGKSAAPSNDDYITVVSKFVHLDGDNPRHAPLEREPEIIAKLRAARRPLSALQQLGGWTKSKMVPKYAHRGREHCSWTAFRVLAMRGKIAYRPTLAGRISVAATTIGTAIFGLVSLLTPTRNTPLK